MTRLVTIDAKDLLQLMLHYNDGQDIPLDAEILNVGVSPILSRWIVFMCKSDNWPTGTYIQELGCLSPLHVRYVGKKIMILSGKGVDPTWSDTPDAPKLQ